MIDLVAIRTVAAKEFRDRLRNRWVLAVSAVFTLFALVTLTSAPPSRAKWACAASKSPSPAWSAW